MTVNCRIDENTMNLANKAVEAIEKMPIEDQKNYEALGQACMQVGYAVGVKETLIKVTTTLVMVGITGVAAFFVAKKLKEEKTII